MGKNNTGDCCRCGHNIRVDIKNVENEDMNWAVVSSGGLLMPMMNCA
jgi:hypothetical protein